MAIFGIVVFGVWILVAPKTGTDWWNLRVGYDHIAILLQMLGFLTTGAILLRQSRIWMVWLYFGVYFVMTDALWCIAFYTYHNMPFTTTTVVLLPFAVVLILLFSGRPALTGLLLMLSIIVQAIYLRFWENIGFPVSELAKTPQIGWAVTLFPNDVEIIYWSLAIPFLLVAIAINRKFASSLPTILDASPVDTTSKPDDMSA